MKRVLLGLCAIVLLLVGGVTMVASMQSDVLRVERSSVIHAPPPVVHALVNDFREWQRWQPWGRDEPNMTNTYTGPDSGEGASTEWNANGGESGRGKMTILSSGPDRIEIDLEFLEPWQASNPTSFDFEEAEDGTRVTWVMTGTKPLMMRIIALFQDIEGAIASDFDKGFDLMDKVAKEDAEAASAKTASALASPPEGADESP